MTFTQNTADQYQNFRPVSPHGINIVCRFTTKFVTTSARSVLKHLLQLLISGNTWPLMAWEKSSLATFAQKRKVFYHLFFSRVNSQIQSLLPIFSFHNRDSAIFHRKKHAQQYTHFCSICNKGFYKSSCVSIKATSIQPLSLIQHFIFDRFSANCCFDFAETLSFLL